MKKSKFFGQFECKRTSVWGDESPCPEAVQVDFIRVDRRTVDDPMKNEHIGKAWYNDGENHRVENGMIARDFKDKRWVVNLPNEAALSDFFEKYGPCVIYHDTGNIPPIWHLEIYDDYRE